MEILLLLFKFENHAGNEEGFLQPFYGVSDLHGPGLLSLSYSFHFICHGLFHSVFRYITHVSKGT